MSCEMLYTLISEFIAPKGRGDSMSCLIQQTIQYEVGCVWSLPLQLSNIFLPYFLLFPKL